MTGAAAAGAVEESATGFRIASQDVERHPCGPVRGHGLDALVQEVREVHDLRVAQRRLVRRRFLRCRTDAVAQAIAQHDGGANQVGAALGAFRCTAVAVDAVLRVDAAAALGCRSVDLLTLVRAALRGGDDAGANDEQRHEANGVGSHFSRTLAISLTAILECPSKNDSRPHFRPMAQCALAQAQVHWQAPARNPPLGHQLTQQRRRRLTRRRWRTCRSSAAAADRRRRPTPRRAASGRTCSSPSRSAPRSTSSLHDAVAAVDGGVQRRGARVAGGVDLRAASSSSRTASTAPASVGTRMRGPSPRGAPEPLTGRDHQHRRAVRQRRIRRSAPPSSSSTASTSTSLVRAARISGVAPRPKFSVAPGSSEILSGAAFSVAFGLAPCASSTFTSPAPSSVSRKIGAGRLCTHCSVFHLDGRVQRRHAARVRDVRDRRPSRAASRPGRSGR